MFDLSYSSSPTVSGEAKIGASTYTVIDGTQRRLDTTVLADGVYPMDLELEAQGTPCWIYQGGSGVTLPANHFKRLCADEWELVRVAGAEEAYFSVLRESTATSGLLVATRIDRRGA